MWSGPRNISTAMMRSWGNREDTVVCDEPLYAHYLTAVDVAHPGRDEVIAHHDTDWRRVVQGLVEEEPGGATVYYQKHMAHHLLPDMDRRWLDTLDNCFLIRDPARMLASLDRKTPSPSLEDTGLPQQVEIFRQVRDRTGAVPPVVDSADILRNPAGMLRRLCDAVGVPWSDRMLWWPAGRRDTDGIWARHWYEAVERSTGFAPPREEAPDVPPRLQELVDRCRPFYEELHASRLH